LAQLRREKKAMPQSESIDWQLKTKTQLTAAQISEGISQYRNQVTLPKLGRTWKAAALAYRRS